MRGAEGESRLPVARLQSPMMMGPAAVAGGWPGGPSGQYCEFLLVCLPMRGAAERLHPLAYRLQEEPHPCHGAAAEDRGFH